MTGPQRRAKKRIYRLDKKEGHFTQVSNKTIRDRTLSLRATGLLCYLLSHSDAWTVSQRAVTGAKKDGEQSVRSAFRELEQAGYLRRMKTHEGGRFGMRYMIYESPDLRPKRRSDETGTP